jgi:hypothetical protein
VSGQLHAPAALLPGIGDWVGPRAVLDAVVKKQFPDSRRESNPRKIKVYKTVILPVVLYGCETWSLTLREEYGLRVFENTVLRRIFGRKMEKIT